MRLFVNELVKLKRSKGIRGVLITFFCLFTLVVLLGFGEGVISDIEKNGFAAPFMWFTCSGTVGFFLFSVIVAGMVAGEFETGVVHRALSSGIRRGSYFAAKIVAVFMASILVYGACIVFFTIAWSIERGFDPEGQIFSDYLTKVLAYNAGACILILSDVALFCFFAYLFRMAALTIAAAVLVTFLDVAGLFKGPVGIAFGMLKYVDKDAILSWDFAEQFLPCLWMIVIFLALSYGLFAIRDVN